MSSTQTAPLRQSASTVSRRLIAGGIAVLAIQALLTFIYSRPEYLPSVAPLSNFPTAVGDWQRTQDGSLEPEVMEMLAPDDVLNREYNRGGVPLNFFVAYYKSQHRVKGAHDPKVCLPGSGWNPTSSKIIRIPVKDGESIPANYYVVAKGASQAVIIYWFQTHDTVFTKEQSLKLDRLFKTVKDNRTDMALVRVVVPVFEGDLPAATSLGMTFAEAAYPYMQAHFSAPAQI